MMYARHVRARLEAALTDTPVTLVVGPRQVGKSTLVRAVIAERPDATYLTLDDLTAQSAARSDPEGFIAGLRGTVAIDEIQRAPELLLAIKAAVDRDRRPGRFVLTGSTNILALPAISDALTGRIDVIRLRPLSQGELAGVTETFLDRVVASSSRLDAPPIGRDDLVARILAGGYPEALGRVGERRDAWFESYITTIVQRDVRDISRVEDLGALPRLLRLLASRVAGLLNVADVSRSLGVPLTTVNRYLAILEAIMLVEPIPAWSANLGRRLVRAPKVGLVDSALVAHLQGMTAARVLAEPDRLGPLLEAFVVEEIRRQLTWRPAAPTLFHYRDGSGNEVDIVLEQRDGSIVGIEVKAAATVTTADTKGLRALARAVGERFVRGVVLYTGGAVVPLGDRLVAAPITALWSA